MLCKTGTNKKSFLLWKLFCDPAGARTQDPIIKSDMLYQLSYGIIPFSKGDANIKSICANFKKIEQLKPKKYR